MLYEMMHHRAWVMLKIKKDLHRLVPFGFLTRYPQDFGFETRAKIKT
jgi:hypothetical protein